MAIRVPASSANLGPGFDALGVALTWHLDASTTPFADEPDRPAADEAHPAVAAFRRLGGVGPLHVRSGIPMGRGLGFSGAARVAGLLAALEQRAGGRLDVAAVAGTVLAEAAALEGHADNVAASLHGGVVATAAGRAVRLPLAIDPAVVVWVPPATTATAESRRRLPTTVAFADAVFNVGRTALLVAALTTGDVDALRPATEDRLHQDHRLAASPESRQAMGAALEAGAWAAWLSGSGPAVAALCAPAEAEAVAAALPATGRARVLRIDHEGAVALPG